MQGDIIYISGAITGVKDFVDKFSMAEMMLTDKGWRVINPAKLNMIVPELKHSQYMEICYAMMIPCSSVFVLNGYENSVGAKMEIKFAKDIGMKIYYEKDGFPKLEV